MHIFSHPTAAKRTSSPPAIETLPPARLIRLGDRKITHERITLSTRNGLHGE
jgi:hypothetical protein